MDNTTILFTAIQRFYRNAIVTLIREQLTAQYAEAALTEVQRLFGKKDPETGNTYWEGIRAAANERRSGGTGELSTPIKDEFELLGVEHFYNVFETHFDTLCPSHGGKPKKEKNQAKQTLLSWIKQIKNVRDPISHPVSDDINYDESVQVLFCARKVLDFCSCPDASSEVLKLQGKLLGGYSGDREKTYTLLPPADEVVMDFVGRHGELKRLRDWLSNNVSQRWALSGEGGKGKSAIAYAFAKNISQTDDHGLDAVVWISAKRRRFVEGATVMVDRPDFHDKSTAILAILSAFGEESIGDQREEQVIELLKSFPTLLVIDDIDTVEDSGEDAVQFLIMTLPERTPTKVLITSRRALFGMTNLTTQVQGLSDSDADDFLKSRCTLMGLHTQAVIESKSMILDATDASPLFIEDLLRLIQSGLSIESSVGLWKEKKGNDARRYAIKREFDLLDDDAKQVLLAIAITGACDTDHLCRGLDWSQSRVVDALQQLRKMFLMPTQVPGRSKTTLSLNQNMRMLVLEEMKDTDVFRRTDRTMKAAAGKLATKHHENETIVSKLRYTGRLVKEYRMQDAANVIAKALEQFPGRADLHAQLGWIFKKDGQTSNARGHFQRAHELDCQQRDSYWHWSELEAEAEEWTASAKVAELAIGKFGESQGLLFRLGYALHRAGKELQKDGIDATKECERAKAVLEKARTMQDSEDRNYSLRNQIYRAIALNLESLEDEVELARHFAKWMQDCPNDPYIESEYERLRMKFPKYLTAR